MNNDQITGAITTLVASGLSYAAAKGWIDGTQVGVIATSIVTVGIAIYHVVRNTDANKVSKAAAIVPIAASDQRSAGVTTPITPAQSP